ncbi:ankyrin repeat domain-containing protein 16 isoform 5-T6 [Acridotheres tristis]
MAEQGRPRRLLRLVQEGNLDLLRDELRLDEIPEALSWRWGRLGDSLLHHAARSGHRDVLEFLVLELGMDMEVANGDYKRPIHEAASMGHQECVAFLLQRGASVDCLKKADWTPLMMACTRKNLEVIKTLVEHGANPLLRNKDGWNCFHIASREGHPEVLQYLLDVSPKCWDTESTTGRTPLHTAGASTELTAETAVGSLPSWMPSRMGTLALPGCSCRNTRSSGAAESCPGQSRSVQFQLRDGCEHRADPKFHILQEGHGHTIHTLLALGADIQAKDGKGRSALHVASAGQRVEATRLLLQAGLQDTADGTGMLAQQLARRPQLIQLFQGTQVST